MYVTENVPVRCLLYRYKHCKNRRRSKDIILKSLREGSQKPREGAEGRGRGHFEKSKENSVKTKYKRLSQTPLPDHLRATTLFGGGPEIIIHGSTLPYTDHPSDHNPIYGGQPLKVIPKPRRFFDLLQCPSRPPTPRCFK